MTPLGKMWRWGLVAPLAMAAMVAGCECGEEPSLQPGKDAGTLDAQVSTAYASLDTRQLLVVLGDSVATDLGVPYASSFGALLMENDDEEFPEYAGQDMDSMRPDSDRYNLAVEGARVEDVVRTQLANVPDDTTAVLLVVGLNDFLDAAGQDAATGAASATLFGQKLDEIMAVLRDTSRFQALPHVFVLNLFDATDEVGDTENAYGLAWPDAITVLNAFNAEIGRVAFGPNTHLVDVRTPFLGHGVHFDDQANPHYHLGDASAWLQTDYVHPNRRGHSEIRGLLVQVFFGS